MRHAITNVKNMAKQVLRYRKGIIIHLIILVIFMVIGGITAVSLGQDVNYDLHNYHYNNPHMFIEGKLDKNIAVSGIQSYENPIRDVPAYVLMNNLSPKKAGLIMGALQGINLWLIFEILYASLKFLKLKRYKNIGLSFLVASFTLYGSGFNSELGTTMGDNTTSIFVLLALLLMVYSLQYKPRFYDINLLRFSGFILVGIAAGIKLTNITYIVGLFVAGMFIKEKSLTMFKNLVYDILGILIGVLLAGGLWFTKIYLMYKNPIFPFYNSIFKSKYYPAKNFVDDRWINDSLRNSILEPFSYIRHQAISSEVAFKDPRLAVMFMIIGLVIVASLFKSISKRSYNNTSISTAFRLILIFTLVSYIVWAAQFSYYRYLIPIELLSLVIITLGTFSLFKKFWISSTVVIALCIAITANTIQTSWGRVTWQPSNFGIARQDFDQMENSTVVIAGYMPYSFILPYLPPSASSVRIVSDLSSPTVGANAMQQKIQDTIDYSKDKKGRFYLLVVDEDKKIAYSSVEKLNFGVDNCRELDVIVRRSSPDKYRMCELKYLQE